jgi:4a-hydroxytetrahydrobiopterin dehydratase
MIALTAQEIAPRLAALTGWQIEEGELTRTFSFKDFLAALAFVNRVGEQAEKAGHHPDIDIRYNKVSLWLVTHDAGAPSDRSSSLGWEAGGLTAKDFDLAAVIDRLL